MAVKKKNRISEEELQALADEHMEKFAADALKRYEKALAHYKTQSEDTQDAIDRMVKALVRVTHKKMWLAFKGQKIVIDIPEQTVYHNMCYMATEILRDMAVFDVRVADYTFPTKSCAVCGTEIKTKKKGKK